ncbi:hypothetical protein B296_00012016, partial [Ensete ventricosum]
MFEPIIPLYRVSFKMYRSNAHHGCIRGFVVAKIKECNFDLYRSVRVALTGPPGYWYADHLLLGGTAKIDIGGRLREKSTVGGRLREKKKEEEEKKYLLSSHR